jgi:hypothetical protein
LGFSIGNISEETATRDGCKTTVATNVSIPLDRRRLVSRLPSYIHLFAALKNTLRGQSIGDIAVTAEILEVNATKSDDVLEAAGEKLANIALSRMNWHSGGTGRHGAHGESAGSGEVCVAV